MSLSVVLNLPPPLPSLDSVGSHPDLSQQSSRVGGGGGVGLEGAEGDKGEGL